MKLKIASTIAIVGFFLGSSALAESLTCQFTEPFFDLKIKTENGQGTLEESVSDQESSSQPLQIKMTDTGGGLYVARMILKGEPALLIVDSMAQGSDGMSDMIYPMNALLIQRGKMTRKRLEKIMKSESPRRLYRAYSKRPYAQDELRLLGGCFSDLKPVQM